MMQDAVSVVVIGVGPANDAKSQHRELDLRGRGFVSKRSEREKEIREISHERDRGIRCNTVQSGVTTSSQVHQYQVISYDK